MPALQALAARCNVLLVVTQPDRPAGRGQKLVATPVKAAALELGLEVATPSALRPFAGDVRALGADRAVVASYGRILPQALLDTVPLWYNIHPSQLPLYRGATPIQSVIRDGRATTAVTIIAMDAGMDTGDILKQTLPIALGETETYGELHDRLALVGADLLGQTIDADESGTLHRVRQIDGDDVAATLTRPLAKADSILPPYATAREAVDRIRSLAPAPGAKLSPDLKPVIGTTPLPEFKILRAHASTDSPLAEGRDVPSGTVVANRGYLYLRANDAWVVLDEILPAGKNAMSIDAWANGRRIDEVFSAVGDVIDSLGALRFRERVGELLPQ